MPASKPRVATKGVEHSERAHARLSPSTADTWFECTASIELLEKINPPDRGSDAADEGTGAHEFLEACWKAQRSPIHKSWLGKIFNKKWPVTKEMQEAVNVMYELCLTLELEGWTVYSERRNHIRCIDDKGTLDMCAVNARRTKMKVLDFKYGKGHPVSAVENKQMRLYALGAIDDLEMRNTLSELELIIVQPRCKESPERWMDSMVNLMLFEKKVYEKRNIIEACKGTFNPGEKQCYWCKVKNDCDARNNFAANLVGLDFDKIKSDKHATTPDAGKISDDRANLIAKNIDFINQWMKSLQSMIFDRALAGKLSDFKVVQGDANRKWDENKDVSAALDAAGFAIDDYMPRSLVGLGAVAALFKDKKKADKFLNKMTVRPKGKPVIVSKTDPRPAINIADDFAGITKE